MARSNGQGGQAGRPPQARQPAEPEFYAQPQQPAAGQYAPYPPAPVAYGAPQHPSAAPLARPQAGYPQQPGYYAPAAPPQHPQQQAYHEPAPAYPPQAAQSEHGYYAQPAVEPAHYAGANAGYPPQQPPHYPPPQPNAGYGAPQPPQQYAPQWAPQPAVDPRGYDLGHYAPVYEPQHQGHPHANYQQGYAEPQHYAPEPTWDGTRAGYAPPSAEPPHELGQYGAQPVHGHSQHAPPAQGYAEPHPDEYLDDDEEAEVEPRRRGRGLFVVAGLVCAIGAGAGLAYAYTQFARPGSGGGKPLILKADSQPSKARPDTATNTNGKLPNRLDERIAGAGSDAADDRANDDPNAPRKVRTTTFTMGQPAAGAPAAEPPPAAAPKQTIGMRGVALDNVGPPPASLPGMLPPVTPAPPGMAVAPPPGKAAVPKAQPVARIATATTDAPKAAVPKVKTAAAAKKDADAFSPPATGATRSAVGAPPAGGSGFVAVVASAKSAGDALKAYADLRQKYGATLGDKAADVQASDQSSRGLGMQYRAVVGPPGSRESASAVCAELKAAGHADCWITSF